MAEPVADAASGVDLRDCVWGTGLVDLAPNKDGAGVEALECAAAKVMKTVSGRSAVWLFIVTFNFPE